MAAAREEPSGSEVVLWTSASPPGRGESYPKFYPTALLWDVFILALLAGPCCLVFAWGSVMLLQLPGWQLLIYRIAGHALYIIAVPAVVGVLALITLVPYRVVREAQSLSFDFLLHRKVVPLEEVLELAVLEQGLHHFVNLLRRSGTWPWGARFRWFWGLPSTDRVMFVVLTDKYSFVVCLQDPVQFLVENQKPLDLGARYRTTNKVRIREGESLQTPKVGVLGKGHYLRVREQRGRRVLVEFEDGKTRGWMSYINQLGRFLLAKDHSSSLPAAGAVGASTLTGTYGTAIELTSKTPEGCEE